MQTGKEWFRSKTLWFNILALAVAIAGVFGFGEYLPNVKWGEIIAIAVAIANLFLRYWTSEPIKR